MSSSGYQAWSVSAGEVPTTAYWNILGSNDASFNSGNGMEDGFIQERHFPSSFDPILRWQNSFYSYVLSGGFWYTSSNLTSNMYALSAIVNGYQISVGAIASYTFSASSDTYIDVDSSGNIYYSAVSNNATAPALAYGRMRLAIVITSATAVTTVRQRVSLNTSYNGWAGFDNIGNRVYPVTPTSRILGQAFYNSSASISCTTTTAAVSGWPMSNVVFQADGVSEVEVELFVPDIYYSSGYFFELYIWDSVLNNAVGGGSQTAPSTGISNSDWTRLAKGVYIPSAGSHTLSVYGRSGSGTQTATFSAGRVGWNPAYLIARRLD